MRLRNIILLAFTALLLTLPASGRISNPDARGDVIVAYKQRGADMIAACAKVGNWFESTCDADAEALGVCTAQQVADSAPLPTVTCNQSRVDNHLCLSADLTREIPNPVSCKRFLDDWLKRKLKAFAAGGYQEIRDQVIPAASTPNDVSDDQ